MAAEKWATLHKVPFPDIKDSVEHFSSKAAQEVYVFKDSLDSSLPVVLFFPLVNKQFRHFKKPGVKRQSAKEKDFARFDLFSDPTKFSSFRFMYPESSFDRLASLVEFNILNNLALIKSEISDIVGSKRNQSNQTTWL